MTYQMLMTVGVANSIRALAFTSVRQTARCTINLIYVCLRMNPTILDVGSQFYPEHQLL